MEVGYEYYHEISNLRGTNMNKNLYSIKLNITQDKHSLKRKNLIYEIETNNDVDNKITHYTIVDKTDYENKEEKYTPKDFKRYFYDEISRNFTPLEIEYQNDTFKITNKKDLISKLDKKTFDYFRKYPFKAKDVNTILFNTKKGLEVENLEMEIEEDTVLPYLFKFNKIKRIGTRTVEEVTLELLSGWQVPVVTEYNTEKIDDSRIKIFFKERINKNILEIDKFIEVLKDEYKINKDLEIKLNFEISGYYIYNEYEDILEQIEVNKEIKLFNITTVSKRTLELLEILEIDELELEGFDENKRNQGRTYDEAVGELFEYLDKIGRKKEIDRQEFENFVDGIAFSEKPKIFETLKWYIETNKIGFLELLEGERDRIYISKEDVLKVLEEIFGEL